jgi:hypothetical protein
MTLDADSYDAEGKSAEQIEADIERTRTDIDAILSALERKLAPRQMLDKGIDMMRDAMMDNGGRINDMLRQNALPLGLISAGLGWMLLGRRSDHGQDSADAAEAFSPDPQTLPSQLYDADIPPVSYAHARIKSAGLDGGEEPDVGARLRNAAATGTERARDYVRYAGAQVGDAAKTFTDFVSDHPLAIGALGFFVGWAVGQLVPKTTMERQLMSRAGEGLRDRAATLGNEALETARYIAEGAVDAAIGGAKTSRARAENGPLAPPSGAASVSAEPPASSVPG